MDVYEIFYAGRVRPKGEVINFWHGEIKQLIFDRVTLTKHVETFLMHKVHK